MEEDKKLNDNQPAQTKDNKEIKVSFTNQTINVCFAVIALVILAITKIVINFGATSAVFKGIMSIFIFSLAVIGVIWNLVKNKKPNFEFYFSCGVAVVALLVL